MRAIFFATFIQTIVTLTLVGLLLLSSGCVTSSYNYNPVIQRQIESHYNQRGQYIGRTNVKIYENGSVNKEHFDKSGRYVGRSRSK